MPSLSGQMKALSTAKPALWAGSLVSCAVGALFFVATTKSIESDARTRFSYHASNAQLTIATRVKSYTDVLRGAASLLESNNLVTRRQFRDYVNGLDMPRNFPALTSINFARCLKAAEIADYERRMRAEQAVEWFGKGPFKVYPPGSRAEYCVLTYIEGGPVEAAAFGLDIMSMPYAPIILMASRDTATLVASGQPIAAISRPNRIALGIRVPVYRSDMPRTNVSERRAAYFGSIGIAFSVPKLVQGVLEQIPLEGVRMLLFDRDGDRGNGAPKTSATLHSRLLFDSFGTEKLPNPPFIDDSSNFTATLPVDFNGRTWLATFTTPKRTMYNGYAEYFPWLAMGAGFISSMLIYALLHTLTSSRRRAIAMANDMTKELRDSESALQHSHATLRRLAAHADQIKEGERKRIAREIHDDLGQNLLALRIEADMLASRTGGHQPRLHARARSTLAQIDATIKSVRQIINDLRPTVLDLGLNAAVDWQIAEFERRTGIDCDLIESHHEIQVSDHCATALFRILQESLSNIARHAHATRVRVELRAEHNWVSMTVSDNGVGLRASGRHQPGSFGLVGIEERISILGGSFSVSGQPGAGTTVRVSIPAHDDLALQEVPDEPHAARDAGVALA